MIKRILFSIGITLLVSLVCALFLLNLNFNFLYSFLFFTLLQFVGFFFYGEFIKFKENKLAIMAELKGLEAISKISTNVECPCDRKVVQNIPVSLNSKTQYTCTGCLKKITVFIEPKTALATDPIDVTSLDDPEFIQSIAETLEKQKDVL